MEVRVEHNDTVVKFGSLKGGDVCMWRERIVMKTSSNRTYRVACNAVYFDDDGTLVTIPKMPALRPPTQPSTWLSDEAQKE